MADVNAAGGIADAPSGADATSPRDTPLSVWLREARVLERKSGRPAVLELGPGPEDEHGDLGEGAGGRAADRNIVKVWWPRDGRLRWLARLQARRGARRFTAACADLAYAGIAAPRILRSGASDGVSWVQYRRIPGVTLLDLVLAGEPLPAPALAGFLVDLHDRGVFFRALNLANLVRLPGSAGFALIDVAGTRIHRGALTERARVRNLASLITHPRDIGHMFGGFGQELVAAYAARLPDGGSTLRSRVGREVRRRTLRRMRRRARAGAAPLPIDGIPCAW